MLQNFFFIFSWCYFFISRLKRSMLHWNFLQFFFFLHCLYHASNIAICNHYLELLLIAFPVHSIYIYIYIYIYVLCVFYMPCLRQVVCGKCSNHKASLPCENGRTVRVCRCCHARLACQSLECTTGPPAGSGGEEEGTGGDSSASSSRLSSMEGPDLPFRTRGVLEVSSGNTFSKGTSKIIKNTFIWYFN